MIDQQSPQGRVEAGSDSSTGSLRTFHAFFIFVALLTGLGLGLWAGYRFVTGAGAGYLIACLCGFAFAVGLGLYERWFLRKMKRAHIA